MALTLLPLTYPDALINLSVRPPVTPMPTYSKSKFLLLQHQLHLQLPTINRCANSNEQRDGIYLPKGAAYLLGLQTYAQALQENNSFLNNVAMIPVNLPYNAWFAVINPNQTSETEPISLHNHLIRKSWFLRIESVAPKKCLLVTTKNNLSEARDWIDSNLEPLIHQSIPDSINPPSSHLPRHLDKLTYSATSHTYANILKKTISSAVTPTETATTNN